MASAAIAMPSGIDAPRQATAKSMDTLRIQSAEAEAFMRRRVMAQAIASSLADAVSNCTRHT